MGSPGAPAHRREVERRFWCEVATGVTSEEAAARVGVSSAVGCRWFRHAGGMAPMEIDDPTRRYLSFGEREEIAVMRIQGLGIREIGRRLARDPSTISRELRRNSATRSGKLDYRASVAQWKADLVARRRKAAKLSGNPALRDYVQERLNGHVERLDGTIVKGPVTKEWKGRGKPHRQDRRWVLAWSPEQIASRLVVDFPDDLSMRISHEAIYQGLYVGRGGLKRELVACLRTGRSLRVPRARARQQVWAHVTPETLLSARPAKINDRVELGHWEGDLIIGLDRSAIATLVERVTRLTILIHLPREAEYGLVQRTKHGPALAGYGARTMKRALAQAMVPLPLEMRRSITWDRGKELSQHEAFTAETGIKVYFADPQSPHQRGTNENTNGLLRQYFPKGTDLSRWNAKQLEAVAHVLNTRPRKILGWLTPNETFDNKVRLLSQAGVASTG